MLIESLAQLRRLREGALSALIASDYESKCAILANLQTQWEELLSTVGEQTGAILALDSGIISPDATAQIPGRPASPVLVAVTAVPKSSLGSRDGLAQLLHSIAHIEFNAINLALDALWRFNEMPLSFYGDWLRVAREEAYHFGLLQGCLQALSSAYGDFVAHDGLWEMTERTAQDVVARMALVPRTLEARGLDATPAIQARLRKLQHPHAPRAAEVLEIILRDEIGHVRVGNAWYAWSCQRAGVDALSHFAHLCAQYRAPRLRLPINVEARLEAGFSHEELCILMET